MAWGKSDPKAAREYQKEAQSGPRYMKIEAGKDENTWRKNWFRIMPAREEYTRGTFYHWEKVHYVNSRGIPCPGFKDEFCDICQRVSELRLAGQQDKAYEMSAKFHALMNVVAKPKKNEDGEFEDMEVRVLDISKPTLDELLNEIDGLPENERDITDFETGRWVCIRRKGTKRKNTKYMVELDAGPTAFDPSALNGDEGYDLTNIYQPVEDFQALLAAGDRKALAAANPWEDDEVVDGEFEEQPEPAPAPKSNGRAATATAARPRTAAPSAESEAAKERLRATLAQRPSIPDDGEDEVEDDD